MCIVPLPTFCLTYALPYLKPKLQGGKPRFRGTVQGFENHLGCSDAINPNPNPNLVPLRSCDSTACACPDLFLAAHVDPHRGGGHCHRQKVALTLDPNP